MGPSPDTVSRWPIEFVEEKLGSRELTKASFLAHLRDAAPREWLKSHGLSSKRADKRYNVSYLLAAYRNLIGAPYTQHRPFIPPSPALASKDSTSTSSILSLCSGSLPEWCDMLAKQLRPLISVDTRASYFSYTAFGVSRSLHQLVQEHEVSRGALRIGQLTVERVELPLRLAGRTAAEVGSPEHADGQAAADRELLQHAATAMDLYGERRSVLQFKVARDDGTGEGPTRHFYTDVAQAIQRKSFSLWRTDHDDQCDSTHVFRQEGLFPAVLPQDAGAAAEGLSRFRLLGQLLGRALQDGHLVDIPL